MNEKYKYQYEYAKNKIKRIPLDVRLEDYEKIKSYCNDNQLSVNGFIKQCIFVFLSDHQKD